MVAGKSVDSLPPGWITQFKVKNGRKLKYYYNKETGQKFDTKKEVLHYVEVGNLGPDTPQQEIKPNESSSEPMPLAMQTDETPEWLPDGWIMEVKVQNPGSQIGRKYKWYVDPLTGRKFYSKPQVFEYLKTVELNSCTSKEKEMGNGPVSNAGMGELAGGETSLTLQGSQNLKTLEGMNEQSVKEPSMGESTGDKSSLKLEGTSCASKQKKQIGFKRRSVKEDVIEEVTPDGLPTGWRKEIRIQQKPSGIRRDPYYTDPASGYVFRSQKDALRYLETGDIYRCAIRPKKRVELSFLNEETSVPSAANMQDLGDRTEIRQLFEGTENSFASSLETTDAEGTITPTPTTAIPAGQPSPNPAEEQAEPKESHDPSS